MFDPFTCLGYLAAITLATGSAVSTPRHPLHLAKTAASVDQSSDGQLVLGVASGDRPVEYPAFGLEREFERRGALSRCLRDVSSGRRDPFPARELSPLRRSAGVGRSGAQAGAWAHSGAGHRAQPANGGLDRRQGRWRVPLLRAGRTRPGADAGLAARRTADGEIQVVSPFAQEGLFALHLTPNPWQPRPAAFRQRLATKVWLEPWPRLRIQTA